MNNNPSSRPFCESCTYFNGQAYYNEQDKGHGRCHRYPPSFTESSGDKIHHWQFPLVYLQSWCGEHVPSDTPVNAATANQ